MSLWSWTYCTGLRYSNMDCSSRLKRTGTYGTLAYTSVQIFFPLKKCGVWALRMSLQSQSNLILQLHYDNWWITRVSRDACRAAVAVVCWMITCQVTFSMRCSYFHRKEPCYDRYVRLIYPWLDYGVGDCLSFSLFFRDMVLSFKSSEKCLLSVCHPSHFFSFLDPVSKSFCTKRRIGVFFFHLITEDCLWQ